MMTDTSIPVLSKPIDMMDAGPNGNNLQAGAMARHPVDELQRRQATSRLSFLGSDEDQEVRRLYGSGLAMRLATERNMARESGGRGVSGLPTSNLMHDILTGNDMKMQFEDILSLPEHRPIQLKQDNPHTAMERKLGMM